MAEFKHVKVPEGDLVEIKGGKPVVGDRVHDGVNLSEIPAKTHDLENRKAQYTVVSCLSETSIQARISSS